MTRPPPRPPLSPPPPLLRPPPNRPDSLLQHLRQPLRQFRRRPVGSRHEFLDTLPDIGVISSFDRWAAEVLNFAADRKSTRLNSSHQIISYAVFCLKKKDTTT